jgi:hypothetical protein
MPFTPPTSDREMTLVQLSTHTGHACLKARRDSIGERKRFGMPLLGEVPCG